MKRKKFFVKSIRTTRSRAEHGDNDEILFQKKNMLLLPADVKVRKWTKGLVTHGRIRVNKWVPEHSGPTALKDLRPAKKTKNIKKPKRRVG